MTVRRNARESFDVDRADLAERVREVLREDPIYKDTVESEDGTLFTTNIKPNFLYQSTGLHIALERDDESSFSRTVVDVTTVSQPFVAADVFGSYDRYIGSFLVALRRRIEDPTAAPPRRYGPIRNRYDLRILVLFVLMFVLLPVALALAGLGFLAITLLFYPIGLVAGWALTYLAAGIRRRFGMLAAAPVVVIGLVVAFALLAVAGIVINGLLLGPDAAGSDGAGGLFTGILSGIMLRSRPEGRRGEVSEARDVRGVRGLRRSMRRALLGGPLFPKNYAVLGMSLFGSLPCLALALFILFRGVADTFVFAFLALGFGSLLLGIADTLPIPLRGANAVLRVTGLLMGLVFLLAPLTRVLG